MLTVAVEYDIVMWVLRRSFQAVAKIKLPYPFIGLFLFAALGRGNALAAVAIVYAVLIFVIVSFVCFCVSPLGSALVGCHVPTSFEAKSLDLCEKCNEEEGREAVDPTCSCLCMHTADLWSGKCETGSRGMVLLIGLTATQIANITSNNGGHLIVT